MKQQSLFATRKEEFDFQAAERLPENILFGTSSWNYQGWRGMVYHGDYRNDADLRKRALAEYARFPWFRTVGIDAAFYQPLAPEVLRHYAAMVPPDFRWASKVWEEISIPRYAHHPRYGSKAGSENPNFLNRELFVERVLRPYEESGQAQHAGPFIFEFQNMPLSAAGEREKFLARLDAFLDRLPSEFRYAVEIRNRDLLIPQYFRVLNAHGTAHCFNHWSFMPPLVEQMKCAAEAGGLSADFSIARILTPLGMKYEDAVKSYAPYSEIKNPLPGMRQDVVRLVKRAVDRKIPVYVLVNNRAEGSAPLTINALGKTVVEILSAPDTA